MSAVLGREPLTVPMIRRALALRRAGLPYTNVAAVLALDYGRPVEAVQVRYYLQRYCGVPKETGKRRSHLPGRRAA